MRKFGKYEKMPDGTRAKQPAVKSALLQTYFTSLICLVLCVTMLFGTTFAWFTSEVTNSGNEIYIGTLDVDLLKQNKDNTWTSLNSEAGSTTQLFDKGIYWEPGYTALETIKVKNEGTLSFRYALTFTDGVLNGVKNDEELIKVAQFFTVYVHAGEISEDNMPESFAEIKEIAEDEDTEENEKAWRVVRLGEKPATLADILTRGLPVFSGNIENKDEEAVYTIALHMLETAGQGETQENSIALSKELMGKKIGLNVKLTAYQRTHESDAFNKDYDLQAHVTELGALDITATAGIGGAVFNLKLDQSYQFQPVETLEEWSDSTFKDYIADFVVWCEDDIPANSVALAGYYDAWCQLNNDNWVYLQADDQIEANKQIPLVMAMGNGGIQVHYKDLCQYGNDGIGFLCGVKNLSAENIGKTIIVELRMYTEEEYGNWETSTDYIVAGRYEYTLGAPDGTIDQIP